MAGITFDQMMNLWVEAGGPPQSAAMAAAIADASSGLDPDRETEADGVTKRGLFQIASTLGPMSTTDQLANVRAAVSLSSGGTNFRKWCAAWSDNNCGNDGGEYLGEGSNALSALLGRGGHYSEVGGIGITSAVPTGQSGFEDASSPATKGTEATDTPPKPSTGPSIGLIIFLAIAAAAAYYFLVLKKKPGDGAGGAKTPTPSSSGPPSG